VKRQLIKKQNRKENSTFRGANRRKQSKIAKEKARDTEVKAKSSRITIRMPQSMDRKESLWRKGIANRRRNPA